MSTNGLRANQLYMGKAFTLIELLVVTAIIGLLAGLLLTAVARSKIQAQKVYCGQNLRQICLGGQMYSHDDPQGGLTGSRKIDGRSQMADDDVNWLYPAYISNLKSFICPSTRNHIRTNTQEVTLSGGSKLTVLIDLLDNATNREATGHSYEVFGYWHNKDMRYPRKTQKTVASFTHQNKKSTFFGQAPGPANIWIFLDAVEIHPPKVLIENYPNPVDNHGPTGGNVAFADGHVEWIPVKNYNYRYELSEDAGRTIFPY